MGFLLPFISAFLLAACAPYDGAGLRPGESRLDDVLHTMGQPAMRWQDPDGSLQLSYPRGPMGVHSYMLRLDAGGRLQSIGNVMDMKSFARIRPGMVQSEVLYVLGPAAGSDYYRARDELVWEWRYCDDWNQLARFFVLFDGTQGAVRSTMSLRESQVGSCGFDGSCFCGR